MLVSEVISLSEKWLSFFSTTLNIDPFCRVSLEVVEGDFISRLKVLPSPYSYSIQLNPARHMDELDVQNSIIQELLNILFEDISLYDSQIENLSHFKSRIISKLTMAFCSLVVEGEQESELEGEEDD
jgi:hypothetical protein